MCLTLLWGILPTTRICILYLTNQFQSLWHLFMPIPSSSSELIQLECHVGVSHITLILLVWQSLSSIRLKLLLIAVVLKWWFSLYGCQRHGWGWCDHLLPWQAEKTAMCSQLANWFESCSPKSLTPNQPMCCSRVFLWLLSALSASNECSFVDA